MKTLLFLGAVALVGGCSAPHPNNSGASARVRTLDYSLTALKAEFNRDTPKPRLLALFSPTCGGCLYGARALQQERKATPPITQGAQVLVVWLRMLDTDNELEARQSAGLVDFPGAHHFYDVDKQSSARLTAEQFPNAGREALETMPQEHPKRKKLE